MDAETIRARAGEAAEFLKVLANDRRLMIVCELLQGERSVSELESVVGLSQSALSQHLARLRRERLVTTRRVAQTIHYSLSDPDLGVLIGALSDRFCKLRRST